MNGLFSDTVLWKESPDLLESPSPNASQANFGLWNAIQLCDPGERDKTSPPGRGGMNSVSKRRKP